MLSIVLYSVLMMFLVLLFRKIILFLSSQMLCYKKQRSEKSLLSVLVLMMFSEVLSVRSGIINNFFNLIPRFTIRDLVIWQLNKRWFVSSMSELQREQVLGTLFIYLFKRTVVGKISRIIFQIKFFIFGGRLSFQIQFALILFVLLVLNREVVDLTVNSPLLL